MFLASGNKTALADSTKIVSLFFDGNKQTVTTDATNVDELIKRAGITLNPGDIVEPEGKTAIPNGFFNVNVYRARPVMIVDDGKPRYVQSAYQSPRLIASGAGLELFPEDEISSEIITNFIGDGSVGQKVSIKRALPIVVKVDGKTLTLRTQKNTVSTFLQEQKLPLGAEDVVAPGLNAPLRAGLQVVIVRVKEAEVAYEEPIDHEVQVTKDPGLELGQQIVKQNGADGLRKVTYLISYHNGKEVARKQLRNEIAIPPQSKIVVKGALVNSSTWYKLRVCESSNTYNRNSGNGYYGAYQFDVSTWQAYGGTGDRPDLASPSEQDTIAARLQARRGFNPWPTCARKLGFL